MEQAANRQFVELERTHFWFQGRRRIFLSLLERELGPGADRKVLDVGCGAGGMLEPLSRFGEVTGVDMSAELVAFCHERGFARVQIGTAYELPVAPGTQDLVTLFDTIEHVPDEDRALHEVRRALVPGGLVFISVPAYQFLYANNDRVAHHERRYTAGRLRAKLVRAGLEPVQVTYFNTLLFPLILPAVLLSKLRERFRDPGDRTNLSHPIPARLNRALGATMASERYLLARGSLPFGHSVIAIARRPVSSPEQLPVSSTEPVPQRAGLA